jgi:hypothetical protein
MKRILPLLLLTIAVSARADGAWTKYALSHQAPYPAALVGRPDNLARFSQTTFTPEGNTRTGWQDTAWRSPMSLVTNGVFDLIASGSDEGHLYPMQTGSSAVFVFGVPARVDEVHVYSAWRDNGRIDVEVTSVDVCDAQGNWTSLPGSALPFSDGGASVGWRLVFADSSGAPLADEASGVRVVFGTMDNSWVGIAEIEVIGAHLGTRTVTFCDENGDPLSGVPVQTVATGTAATSPGASLVPRKAGLVFAGWDEDIGCVFENIRPRPVYAKSIDVHGTGQWTKTAFSATPELTPLDKNLARMEGAVLTIEHGGTSRSETLADGEFQSASAAYNMYAGGVVAFDFSEKVRIDGVRFFSLWSDAGRVDMGVMDVEVRDVAGEWTTLDGSELPFVPTSVSPGFEFVFAAPDGRPLANVATGLRIRFGYAENFYVGLPEIEILGDLARKATTLILVK